MDSQKRQAIVLFWSCEPRSFFNFRPPIVHIQALFSPAAHHPKPPTPPLTQWISPINPPRNVALVMERMPGACPAGAVASRRTAACRSASPVWTVDSSTASRRATAPLPAMQCVATVCRGETHCYYYTVVLFINVINVIFHNNSLTKKRNMLRQTIISACWLLLCSWQLWRLKHVILCLQQILQED